MFIVIAWVLLIPFNIFIMKKMGSIHSFNTDTFEAIVFSNFVVPPVVLVVVLIVFLSDLTMNYFYDNKS